jgi:drug/metabolite transporter (DMT)-like permease
LENNEATRLIVLLATPDARHGGASLADRSIKLASVSALAPTQYTLLLWGTILGAVIFGDLPSAATLIGSGVIALAGIFIFHRKSKLGQSNQRTDVPTDLL